MSHYDEFYESLVDDAHKRLKERQAACHHLQWEAQYTDRMGKPVSTRCKCCGLINKIHKEDSNV